MNILLSKGSTGSHVKKLQKQLNKTLSMTLVVDGVFGDATDKAVRKYQEINNLKVDGIIGNYTWSRLFPSAYNPISSLGKSRFVIFVDAGHGGMTLDGKYTTAGKRAYHPKLELHGDGHYYEGYENRLVAESFIEKCTWAGIQTIRTYHPYKDIDLYDRVELIRDYLHRGYYGLLISFHSNAISSKNSKEKLEKTRGFMCFTTTDQNHSDIIAEQHIKNVMQEIGEWKYFTRNNADGDMDIERNFYIISKSEFENHAHFAAILEEFGFHTSAQDCQFIIDNREKRVNAALKTALFAKEYFKNH